MAKSGRLWSQSAWLALLAMIAIFAVVVVVVEELAAVTLEVWLANFRAYSMLSWGERTQASEPDNVPLHSALAA